MFGGAGVRRVVAALSMLTLAAVVTAPPAAASSPAPRVAAAAVDVTSADEAIRGQGIWACLACAVGAGVVIAGGIGGIAAFLATPGSEALIAVCAIECAEAVAAE